MDSGDDRVEILWVRIRVKANKEDILVGVCCRPPYPDKKSDEIFNNYNMQNKMKSHKS